MLYFVIYFASLSFALKKMNVFTFQISSFTAGVSYSNQDKIKAFKYDYFFLKKDNRILIELLNTSNKNIQYQCQ